MFDKDEINDYRDICAPSDLKERISADCRRMRDGVSPKRSFVRRFSAVAACLLLLCSLALIYPALSPTVSVEYDTQKIGREGVSTDGGFSVLTLPVRSAGSISLPLTISCKKEATVSVSFGTLFCTDEDGTMICLGDRAEFTGETEFLWVIGDCREPCEITVASGLRKTVYVFEPSLNTEHGVIYKK